MRQRTFIDVWSSRISGYDARARDSRVVVLGCASKNSYASFSLSYIYMYFSFWAPKDLYQSWFNGKADLRRLTRCKGLSTNRHLIEIKVKMLLLQLIKTTLTERISFEPSYPYIRITLDKRRCLVFFFYQWIHLINNFYQSA